MTTRLALLQRNTKEPECNKKSTEVDIVAGRRLDDVSKWISYFIPATKRYKIDIMPQQSTRLPDEASRLRDRVTALGPPPVSYNLHIGYRDAPDRESFDGEVSFSEASDRLTDIMAERMKVGAGSRVLNVSWGWRTRCADSPTHRRPADRYLDKLRSEHTEGSPVNTTNYSNPPFLDINAPEFRIDSPEVRAATENNWWARTPTGLAVLRYQECQELLRNQQLRIGVADVAAGFGSASSTLFDWLKAIRLSFDGASNRWRRLLVSKAFTQCSIDALRPFMRSRTHELIDGFASNDNCEFMAAFADPYPASVMAKLFDIPPERFETFLGWATGVGLALNPAGAPKLDRINAASEGLHSCFEELVEQRQENPGDDFVSTLLTSESEGKSLTSEEVSTLLSILIFGSQAAIRNQLGLAMLTFSRHPEQWRLLVERPELARTAVDELMRINPAVTAIPRVSAEDFTFQGLDILSGTRVLLFTATANTQPDTFGDASFDITAQRPPHLTFGAGVHHCPGAGLARAQMSEALLILASRLGDITLTRPPQLRPRPGLTGPVTVSLRSSSSKLET